MLYPSWRISHTCCLRELFTTIQLFKSSVLVADGRQIQIEGKGNVELETISNGKRIKITMTDVLFAPTMKINLISIGILAKKGFIMIFNNKLLYVIHTLIEKYLIPKNKWLIPIHSVILTD